MNSPADGVDKEPILPTAGQHDLPVGGRSGPLVSVIIPAFRCAQYVAQAVESVLSQSFSNHEVLVINDGSPDTPLLEQALAPYQHRIRYIKQATSGPAGARNTGIRRAEGKYLAFLDSDDYWSADHLWQQLALLEQDPTLDLVYCDYMLIKDERQFARAFDLQPQSAAVNFEALLVEDCAIGMSTVVGSREAILRAGLFDQSLLRCEDFEMWLRMSLTGARMAYHPGVQVFHRINEAGLSADKWSMKKDRIRVYEKMAANFSISERQRGIVRELIARTEADCHVDELKRALEKGDYAEAFAAARRASAAGRNWKVKASLLGLRVMPGLFRRVHLVRSFFQRDGKYSGRGGSGPANSAAEDAVKTEENQALVGSGSNSNR